MRSRCKEGFLGGSDRVKLSPVFRWRIAKSMGGEVAHECVRVVVFECYYMCVSVYMPLSWFLCSLEHKSTHQRWWLRWDAHQPVAEAVASSSSSASAAAVAANDSTSIAVQPGGCNHQCGSEGYTSNHMYKPHTSISKRHRWSLTLAQNWRQHI